MAKGETLPCLKVSHRPFPFHLIKVLAKPDDKGQGIGPSKGVFGKVFDISIAETKGSKPDKFALVVAKGPLFSRKSIASSQAGILIPIDDPKGFKDAAIGPMAGKTIVNAPGH